MLVRAPLSIFSGFFDKIGSKSNGLVNIKVSESRNYLVSDVLEKLRGRGLIRLKTTLSVVQLPATPE